MKQISFLKLFLSVAIVLSAGLLGSIFTSSSVSSWYLQINKPVWNPPSWVFGPVWTTLYILMGISLYLIWNKKTSAKTIGAIKIFSFQLGLNILWSAIFFGLRNMWLALAEIIILWLAIVFTIKKFWKIQALAGILLLPYLLWVSFATFLNFTIASLN